MLGGTVKLNNSGLAEAKLLSKRKYPTKKLTMLL